jgi:hypothetical protein
VLQEYYGEKADPLSSLLTTGHLRPWWLGVTKDILVSVFFGLMLIINNNKKKTDTAPQRARHHRRDPLAPAIPHQLLVLPQELDPLGRVSEHPDPAGAADHREDGLQARVHGGNA